MIFAIKNRILNNLKYIQNVQLKRFYSSGKLKPPWSILFFGNDDFSLFSLKALVNEYRSGHLIDRLEVCTSVKKTKNVVHTFAEKENLKINQWPLELLENEFDTGLVVSFGHLIPNRIIKKFPFGMVNVHASLLPRWRGAAPIIYTLANGDDMAGITIMKIKPKKFDMGEIISQKSLPISDKIYLPELYSKLGDLGAKELVECLKDLPSRLENAAPQPQENATYAPKIDSTFSFIKWKEMTSIEIYNLDRSIQGFMPVRSIFNGETIQLFNITRLDEENMNENVRPGFITYDNSANLLKIVCTDRKIVSVKKVKVFSKRLMSASDFNNGYLAKIPIEKRYFT